MDLFNVGVILHAVLHYIEMVLTDMKLGDNTLTHSLQVHWSI